MTVLDCGGKFDATPLFGRLRQSNLSGHRESGVALRLPRQSETLTKV